MQDYQIIETGGSQYLVKSGQQLDVDLLSIPVNEKTTFVDKLSGKTVTATVLAHGKRPTVRVIKFKNKTRSLRRHGQRQRFTTLRIETNKSVK